MRISFDAFNPDGFPISLLRRSICVTVPCAVPIPNNGVAICVRNRSGQSKQPGAGPLWTTANLSLATAADRWFLVLLHRDTAKILCQARFPAEHARSHSENPPAYAS